MNGFVLVTVVVDHVGAELVLPAVVPLIEVVPDLFRSVGLLDAGHVHEVYDIETATGHRLSRDLTLRHQGVVDGTVLALVPADSVDHTARYDCILPPPRRRRSLIRRLR